MTRIDFYGDTGILVNFGGQIDPGINQRVHNLSALLEANPLPGLIEVVPGYASLLVVYDPSSADVHELVDHIRTWVDTLHTVDSQPAKLVEVPTHYGGEHGADLDFVARHAGLSAQRVIEIHSRAEYLVYMMGFSPGFPYLGGMDAAIAAPRLDTPRTRVPAGSVGIAGSQTGIYSIDSPGGWRLIGYTPLRLFDLNAPQPFLLKPGDRLRFIPVREGEIGDGA